MTTSLSFSPSVARPAPRSAASSLEQALAHAETGSIQLESAHQDTRDSYSKLDGFQPATHDIARDTPYRDVSASARSLQARADATSTPAQNASGKQYDAIASFDYATAALDHAIPGLSPADQQKAFEAREKLQQRDPLWHADVALGSALASINGGARPYMDAAATDAPGQDVSWTAGEIHGSLNEALGNLGYAGDINSASLAAVNNAVAILRDILQRKAQ